MKYNPPCLLDYQSAMARTPIVVKSLFVLTYAIAYAPKHIFGLLKSGFGFPRTIVAGLMVYDIRLVGGKLFGQLTRTWTSDFLMMIGKLV